MNSCFKMLILPLLIATVTLILPIGGQFLVPLLCDSLAELAIEESLGISNDNFNSPSQPNYTESIVFRLYTRREFEDGIVLPTNSANLSLSSMDPTIPTKIFVFGFQTYPSSEAVQILKRAYLENGEYNFIVVDWSPISKQINYLRVRRYAGGVASVIAKFLDTLADSRKCLPKDQHILGHSLGAHIAGLAAGGAKTKPARCTGLDPAGPLYGLSSSEGRIDSTVATLVDILHTAGGSWGLATPVGHVDFYANGGTWPQPDCFGAFLDSNGFCSHLIALNYYVYTISHPTSYIGYRCQTSNIIKGVCPEDSEAAVMGEHVVFGTPGMYYVETRINISVV